MPKTERGQQRKRRKRANGEGTIYQATAGKHKGLWVAQITIGTNPKTRKPKRKSFYGRTRGEVKDKLEAYQESIGQGLDVETAKRLTFGEWIAQWLDLYKRPKVRLSTYEAYSGHVKGRIVPALGHITLLELNSDHIQAFYNGLQGEGLAPATIHKMHQIIHPCLNKAVEKRLLLSNPSQITERPTVRIREGKAMTEEDMDRFLGLIDAQPNNWRAAFLVLLGTGLRIGELLALEWGDVDLENGMIDINKGLSRTKEKGLVIDDPKSEASAALVPVPEEVLQALRKHKTSQAIWILKQGEKYKNRKLVFPSMKGTLMFPRNFQRKYYDLLKKAEVEHIKLHGLRHTFATRLLEQGENLRVVQQLMRHADIKTTGNYYSHVSDKVKQKAAKTMDNLLKRRKS